LNTKEMARQVRQTHWTQIMRERKESGLSIRGWCREKGINEKTFYYWQRQLREAACERFAEAKTPDGMSLAPARFAEVTLATPALSPAPASAESSRGLRVEIGDIRIDVGSEYPADKLALLLRELLRPC
jgi:transposase-like protein